LVKEVLNCLGIENFINSPTFTLIEPYEINDLKIFHIDLYRVEKITELSAIGLEEYLQEANSINFIEWPEKGSGFLKILILPFRYITKVKLQENVKFKLL
jgi:tRNA threonylcarbamoyladenosine biosynthesis protein TsaE